MVLSAFKFRKKDEMKNAMVPFDNKLVMKACVEMVTVNGRPFSALFDCVQKPETNILFYRNEMKRYFSRNNCLNETERYFFF
jgi:hypothetical protein